MLPIHSARVLVKQHAAEMRSDLQRLMYRKNKNPFHKERLTDGYRVGLMGMV